MVGDGFHTNLMLFSVGDQIIIIFFANVFEFWKLWKFSLIIMSENFTTGLQNVCLKNVHYPGYSVSTRINRSWFIDIFITRNCLLMFEDIYLLWRINTRFIVLSSSNDRKACLFLVKIFFRSFPPLIFENEIMSTFKSVY